MNQVARKICATCGRQISWRKKWEKNWSVITYCSNTCRTNKVRPNSLDTSFESKILSLLAERSKTQGAAAVITCEEAEAAVLQDRQDVTGDVDRENRIGDTAKNPKAPEDEAAETGAAKAAPTQDGRGDSNLESKDGDKSGPGTRTRERCRQAARRLAERGEIRITQHGKVTDPSFTKGVMELKLPE